jgi:hypothetical protein
MPRKRSTAEATVATVENNTNGEKRMAGSLTPEQISALLGKSRTKGQYVVLTNEFLASGEVGVDVREQWPELKDKKATTLKQGFENAKKNKDASEGADKIKVAGDGDGVFIINLALASA